MIFFLTPDIASKNTLPMPRDDRLQSSTRPRVLLCVEYAFSALCVAAFGRYSIQSRSQSSLSASSSKARLSVAEFLEPTSPVPASTRKLTRSIEFPELSVTLLALAMVADVEERND